MYVGSLWARSACDGVFLHVCVFSLPIMSLTLSVWTWMERRSPDLSNDTNNASLVMFGGWCQEGLPGSAGEWVPGRPS